MCWRVICAKPDLTAIDASCFCARKPRRAADPWAVNVILQSWLKRSGLELGHVSPHTLRHSLAVHFLRRGVSMKCIGDTLGHRNLTSTAQYLRLNVDDLRKAGLPVPKPAQRCLC